MYYYFDLQAFPQITQFYSVTRNTVWEITDRDHILIFIQEGKCKITYENEEYTLNPGDIFYIPASHAYSRRSIQNSMCTMTYIHFTLTTEPETLELNDIAQKISASKTEMDNQLLEGTFFLSHQSSIYLQNKHTPKQPEKIFEQLNNILLLSISRQLMCGLQSSIVLCSILSALSQHTIESVSIDSSMPPTNKVPDNLKKAIRYIRGHYTEKISLDQLATHCNVSKQQLIRYFKSTFHKTPITYLTEYKITCAKMLLFNHPQLTIGEISDELGFDNQHYFTRVFLKMTGETPSHYRYRTLHYSEYIKENENNK